MKLTIDDVAKTIQIEGCENLGDVMYKIKRMFPDGDWMEYKLIPMIVVQKEWICNTPNPGILQIPYQPYQPYQPEWTVNPIIVGSGGTGTINLADINNTLTCENIDGVITCKDADFPVDYGIAVSQQSGLVTFTNN